MPRAAVISTAVLAVGLALFGARSGGAADGGLDPHMDQGLLPRACTACHEGHGTSGSPMLPAPQRQVCLACHDSRARAAQEVTGGSLSMHARPTLLAPVLTQPYTHPVSEGAFSRDDPGAVTCTSCHSPHRATPQMASADGPPGRSRPSPRSPSRFEFELCATCHGGPGAITSGLADIGDLTSAGNRSYHPVEAPAMERAPSVVPELVGMMVNCTDCHGNSDPTGPRGPHGSAVPHLLRRSYTTVDGSAESASVYALCYGCHSRDAVLDGTAFPEHRRHVVAERTPCSSCHDPHGSPSNRALIRFGEGPRGYDVGPSASGRLAFGSAAPGAGTCYLTCHGRNHDPESYGGPALEPETLVAPLVAPLRTDRRGRPRPELGLPRSRENRRPPP